MLEIVQIYDVVIVSIRAVFKETPRPIFNCNSSSERDLIILSFFGWSWHLDDPTSLLKADEIGLSPPGTLLRDIT